MDQLAGHHVHNEAYRRLGGVAAVNRIDNLKSGIATGCGPCRQASTKLPMAFSGAARASVVAGSRRRAGEATPSHQVRRTLSMKAVLSPPALSSPWKVIVCAPAVTVKVSVVEMK
jgi:hypothetical protein